VGATAIPASNDPPGRDLVSREELVLIIGRDAGLRDALLGWAMSHTRDPPNAEDLFQHTIEHALDPKNAAWDRAHYATAGAFLGSVMNGLARNRLRSPYRARREDLDETKAAHVAAPEADPERQLRMARDERKRIDMEEDLRARIAGKTIPLGVLDWSARGAKGNRELADRIGCTIPQVVAAKQLLREQGAIVKAKRASEPGAA
jgi:hypothetical protein